MTTETIPELSQERVAMSAAVAESMNRTSAFRNTEATRAVAAKRAVPAPLGRLDQPQTFRLDPDMALALEDQWKTSGIKDWGEWLETTTNEALRAFLGI